MKRVKKVVPGVLETVQEPIQKITIISKFNFGKRRYAYVQKGKSLTVPGRALTLRQIADRFASGLQVMDEKIALYDEGQKVIKGFEKLDLTERQEIIEQVKRQILEQQHQKQLEAKKKQDDHFTDLLEKRVQEELEKRTKKPVQSELPITE